MGDLPIQDQHAPPPSSSDEGLEALWQHVLSHFEQDAAHDAFVSACVERGKLALAAAKYRQMERECRQAEETERAAKAEAQLKQLLATAMSLLESSRSAPPRANRAITVVAAIVSGGIILACLAAMSQ